MNHDQRAAIRNGPKTRNLATHSRQRFDLRFDIDLTPEVRKEIIWMIRTGRSTFVDRRSNAVSSHRVQVQGRDIVVVYDKVRGVIVTVLYPEGLLIPPVTK